MASSAPSALTAFQREVLDAFFQRERGFFPAGGAAPAGFHFEWLLSEVKISGGIELPAGVSPAELRAYLADLIRRLAVLAVPEDPVPA